MVPIIGTFEAQEQGRVSGRSQPTHSITEVCVYNTGREGGVQATTKCRGLCGVKVTSQQPPSFNRPRQVIFNIFRSDPKISKWEYRRIKDDYEAKRCFPSQSAFERICWERFDPTAGTRRPFVSMRRLFEPFKRKEGYLETFCWGCAAPFNSPARTLPITTLGT